MTSQDQLSHSIVQDCIDAIVARTSAGTIISWNRAAEDLFGYSATEMLGRSIMPLVPAHLINEELDVLARVAHGEQIRDLLTIRLHKNGSLLPVRLTISPLFDAAGTVAGDCKIARRADAVTSGTPTLGELIRLAYHDQLTGLSNRVHLVDRIHHSMQRNARSGRVGGVIFIDLDDFKYINDTHGHTVGDHLLVDVAQRIRRRVRETDTCARWGGDEFVVVIEDLAGDPMLATDVLQRICHQLHSDLASASTIEPVPLACTASIGATLFHGIAIPLETVVAAADHAMYQAKRAGKNAVHVVIESVGRGETAGCGL